MTIRVGLLGMGMMGKCHHDTYAKIKGVRVEAVCDADAEKRKGQIGHDFGEIDVSGYRVYSRAEQLLADPNLDVIDISLPTFLHAKYTIAALRAGKHVICEKPMARSAAEAKSMVAAARKTGKKLFLAHCIRFWPSYAKAREIVQSGRYGSVRTARFCRLSGLPGWSWKNWLQQSSKSGLCALDLHIHDADFVMYLFGKPKSVLSVAGGLRPGSLDHIITAYNYGGGRLISAEGAWEYASGYPFSMTFSIAMERATLDMTRDLKLMIYPVGGSPKEVKVPAGDGYLHELRHFIECIHAGEDSPIIPPESALNSIQLVEAEIKSARTGKPVTVRF